jgi:uncharacterized protein
MKEKIIDFHTHFPADIYPKKKIKKQFIYDTSSIIEEMDNSNTAVSVVSSIEPMFRESWKVLNPNGMKYGGNENAFQSIRNVKHRLKGAFVPNCFEKPQIIKEDINYFYENFDCRAIKIHPWIGGFPANSYKLKSVFEIATELKIPILYHSGTIPFTTPAEIFDMAKKFPKTVIILGHSGGTELWYDVMALANYAKNLYIETSGQPNRIFLEKFVEKYGSERVIYGSDWLGTTGKMFFRILEVKEIKISEKDKRNILFNNAKRLLKL